ncbi:MAG: hypothetical protein HY553_16060 [Elusimicrobia bacterium]|nr:hypothetical protein [Elusimicrobiota bacterium]
MILFPWLVLLVALVIGTILVLEASDAGRSWVREHRFHAHRPRMRTVAILTAIEVVVILVWALVLLGREG